MNQILKLVIQDGSQVGQKIEVPSEKCSVGGQGSGADLELSGLPYGIKFVDLVLKGKNWTMVEFEPRSALLNQKQLKRRNKLSVGDEITLPSVTSGMPFRMVVELEAVKKTKDSSGGNILEKVNGTVVALAAVYVFAMIGAAMYLMANQSTGPASQEIVLSEVSTALEADLGKLSDAVVGSNVSVPLSDSATSYTELALFLSRDIPLSRKSELRQDFTDKVMKLFSEAWLHEQQERWTDAQERYLRVAEIMGDRNLQTTELALVKARQASAR